MNDLVSTLPIQKVLAPATADELADCVRAACEAQTPLYPIGGGTSLDYGLPAKAAGHGLSLQKLQRVIDYPARDMTVTVEAGLTMATLAELLAREGQRLPIDVPQADRATIGGVIATNWNGPRRFGEGTVRDYVIGISAVDGRGMPFKGGGRVVKNVAGYDFCKLLTGSLGTLGVITQVTLRTKPIPEQSALLACAVPDLDAADRLLAGLVTSQTTPTAVELLAGSAWDAEPTLRAIARLGGGALYLVAGLEGTGPEVESMVRQLTSEWRAAGCEEPLVVGEVPLLWSKLVEFPAAGRSPLALLASVVPSGVTAMVAATRQLDPQCSLQAHAGSGSIVIRLSQLPAEGVARALASRLRPVAAAHHGHVVVLSCEQTSELTHASVFGATNVPVWLMDEVRRKFDPREILNRGRFVC